MYIYVVSVVLFGLVLGPTLPALSRLLLVSLLLLVAVLALASFGVLATPLIVGAHLVHLGEQAQIWVAHEYLVVNHSGVVAERDVRVTLTVQSRVVPVHLYARQLLKPITPVTYCPHLFVSFHLLAQREDREVPLPVMDRSMVVVAEDWLFALLLFDLLFLSEYVVGAALAVLELIVGITLIVLFDCQNLVCPLVGMQSLGLHRSTLVLYSFDYLDLVVRMGFTHTVSWVSLLVFNWRCISLLLPLVFNILLP